MKKIFLILLLTAVLLSVSCGTNNKPASVFNEPIDEFNITCLDDYLTYMHKLTSFDYDENDILLYGKNIKFRCEVTKDYQVCAAEEGYSFDIDFSLYGDTYAYYAYKDGSYIYDFCGGNLASVNLPVDYFFLAYQNTKITGIKNDKKKYVSVDEVRKIFNDFPKFTDEKQLDISKIFCAFNADEEFSENYLYYNNLSALINNYVYVYVYALNSGQEIFMTDDYNRSMIKDFSAKKEDNKIHFSYRIESFDDKSYSNDVDNVKDIYSTVSGTIDVDTKLLSISIDYIVNNNGELWKHVILNNTIEVNDEQILFNPETVYNESIDAIHY